MVGSLCHPPFAKKPRRMGHPLCGLPSEGWATRQEKTREGAIPSAFSCAVQSLYVQRSTWNMANMYVHQGGGGGKGPAHKKRKYWSPLGCFGDLQSLFLSESYFQVIDNTSGLVL